MFLRNEEQKENWHRKLGKIFTRLHSVGHFLIAQGFFDEALKCFEDLSYNDDTYECGDYAYGIGLCYEGKGDLEKALEWLRIAYVNNPPVWTFSESIERVTKRITERDA